MNLFHKSSFLTVCLFFLCACGSGTSNNQAENDVNSLSNAEWKRVQEVFQKATGKEIEDKPIYCGEWRSGKQYKTKNYANGQYLIDMDTDGYPHLIVWVGDDDKVVAYNRLEDQNAPSFVVPDDGAIHLIDGELGEYGKEVTIPSDTYGEYTYIWYMVPSGSYNLVNEGIEGTIFVVADNDSNDERAMLNLRKQGETFDLVVEDGTHIETSIGTRVSLTLIN